MVWSKTTLFRWQDPYALVIFTEAASDDLQQYLAGMRYQLDTPVVAALCFILLLVEYHDDGIFPLLRPPRPLQKQTTILSTLHRWEESPLRVISNSLTQTPSGPTAFPFANKWMTSVSSCIVG